MKRVFIIAGEASGDLHAAELIKSALQINPDIQFFGMGGEKMAQAGAKIIVDNKNMSVVGIFELLWHSRVIYKAVKIIKKVIKHEKPDLVIFVDYPAMNLRLAKKTFKNNLNSLYFISPQIWAWKEGRIEIIKKCINHLAVIFPFEVEYYKRHNVPASYVGNPMVNEVKASMSKAQAYAAFKLNPQQKVFALLPGSRGSELKYNFTTIINAAKLIKKTYPDAQFLIPSSNNFSEQALLNIANNAGLCVTIVHNQLYNALSISDCAICVSGTVTLEVALMGVPFVILYKLNKLTFQVAKHLVKIDKIGLCNLVAGKIIAKEFIQYEATPSALAEEIIRLMEDKPYRQKHLNDFKNLKQQFLKYPQQNIGEIVNNLIN